MNRTQVMSSAIKSILPGARLCGQVRTVATMVGDCGPICNLIGRVRPGEVLVVDARDHRRTAYARDRHGPVAAPSGAFELDPIVVGFYRSRRLL